MVRARRPILLPPLALLLLGVMALVAATARPGYTEEKVSEPKELVEKARLALEAFLEDQRMGWFRDHVTDARGVLIVPQMLKGAFFIGGSGGSGVLLARDAETKEWSYPAFYTLGGLSFGLQFGGEASELVILVMSEKGVEAMLSSTVKLGADASIAVGPIGGRVEGSTAPNLSADLLSFARSKGLFGGVSLEGAAVAARDSWNHAYYGKPIRPIDILIKRTVKNTHADRLRSLLRRASQGVNGDRK